ncbi:MAG: hypothetical protein NTX03_01890 [Bacteroidetes bacterium]|nr:hypothetical protein [Bacteroidota bacterium]
MNHKTIKNLFVINKLFSFANRRLVLLFIIFNSCFHFTSAVAGQPPKGKKNPTKLETLSAGSSVYKVDNQVFETWLPWANKWRNSDQLNYTYSTQQNLLSIADFGWDTLANKWVPNTFDSIVYDSANRKILQISKIWNGSTFINISEEKDSFNGNIKVQTISSWDGTKWLVQFRDIYSLGALGKDTLDISQGWNNGTWDNVTKYQSKYNSAGKITSKITSQYMAAAWQITDKEDTYYDGNTNDTLYVHQSYDTSTAKWNYVFLQESKNTYDGAGNLIKIIQNGSYNNISWMPFTQYNYAYNANNNDTQFVISIWDSISKSWDYNARYSLGYKVFTAIDGAAIELKSARVYPNPTSQSITLSFEVAEPMPITIIMSDASGKISLIAKNGMRVTKQFQVVN